MRKDIVVLSALVTVLLVWSLTQRCEQPPTSVVTRLAPADTLVDTGIRLGRIVTFHAQDAKGGFPIVGCDRLQDIEVIDAKWMEEARWRQDSAVFMQSHRMPVWSFSRYILDKCEWARMVDEHHKRLNQKTAFYANVYR